jgi:hypothetical protein
LSELRSYWARATLSAAAFMSPSFSSWRPDTAENLQTYQIRQRLCVREAQHFKGCYRRTIAVTMRVPVKNAGRSTPEICAIACTANMQLLL